MDKKIEKKEIKIAAFSEDRKNLDIRAGDTVRVWQKIVEIEEGKNKKEGKKEKTRLQAFEGLVLARKHGKEPGATFTVRRVASGVGMEKIFPLYSPIIDKIEILKRSKTRRAKLYHIREKVAKEVRREMRNIRMTPNEVPAPVQIEETEREEVIK